VPSQHVEIFKAFLKLGLSSFGGPIAHLGYFKNEFVEKRKWLGGQAYADLVSLCQFLPGPASSQVGMALGLSRGGIGGALLAWLGFTLPSAILLVVFGLEFKHFQGSFAGWLHGLKIVSVAVVAQAIWSMAKPQMFEWRRIALVAASAAAAALFPSLLMQIAIILTGGLCGFLLPASPNTLPTEPLQNIAGRRSGLIFLSAFLFLLTALP
jgi:chromate transporter